MPYTFIGVGATWATQLKEDILNIPRYNMNTISDQIKGRRGKSLYFEYNTI